jgi:hypothetical protein
MSLFSTYSTGENRVTASILEVLRALSLRHAERILGAMLEAPELQLLEFASQVARGGRGVPDATISSNIRLLIETKIVRNAIDVGQIERHVERLNQCAETKKYLLVLTPDAAQPPNLDRFPPKLVVWSSFADLNQAIDELFEDKEEVISERDAYLLRELQAMLEEENLLAATDEVLVVAARWALDEYRQASAYVCQPNRRFRDVERMVFYTQGAIAPFVPKVIAKYETVEFRRGAHSGPLGAAVDALLDRGARPDGAQQKVILLTPPDHPDTISLKAPVVNDLTSAGRPIAFTQGQRYVSLERLRSAQTTTALIR